MDQADAIVLDVPQTTLDSFPPSVIKQIFIYAGPHNNLPLVNKRINQILRFDPNVGRDLIPRDRLLLFNPELDDDPDVYLENWSLVKSMVEHYYLFDMNERLDFDLIDTKFEFYNHQLEEYESRYGRVVTQDTVAPLISDNLNVLSHIISEYKSHKYALLDSFFYNKLATVSTIRKLLWEKVISKLTVEARKKYTSSINTYDLMQFRTMKEINFHKIRRLQIIRFKFDELQYYFTRLPIEIATGRFEPIPEIYHEDYMDIILKSRNQSTTAIEDNPELPVYDDEESPIEGFEDFGLIDSFYAVDLCLEVKYVSPSPFESNVVWAVSPALVKRDLELAFERISIDYIRDPDAVVSAILRWFHPESISTYLPKHPFRDYVLETLENRIDWEASGSLTVLYAMFDLFDVYSKQDFETIESRRIAAFMLEDIIDGMSAFVHHYCKTLDFTKMSKYLRDLNNTALVNRLIVRRFPLGSLYDEL
ncbi:uncharacterized protein J8A68_005742 [[Candida] subhashii]|uniref:Uncharacterized protein n=1 Tax=[Candida] subhashii TaxID=561895 RepID=A0A8J5QFS7_9ASCO|nr:uncharacterized protein J8A68_005742 [[Candida] subhashii]KAG7660780.1 hypothetical protein J8A68_005742 [[Candida] subhashii]